MRILFSVIVVSVLIFGCDRNASKKVKLENFEFKTGDDTELFFKNVRQSYYDLEVNKASEFNLFRLSSRMVLDTLPILNLAIVINVIQDEAYLFLEPNEKLAELYPLTFTWIDPSDGSSGQIKQSSSNRDGMLQFASQVYEGLQKNYTFELPNGEPILKLQAERNAFRITASDYYRLTRLD